MVYGKSICVNQLCLNYGLQQWMGSTESEGVSSVSQCGPGVRVPVYSNYLSIDMAWDDEPPTQLPIYKD